MRTSFKILSAALALIFISLVVYDTNLKAEYLKGDFRKPYGDFVPANYSNFNAVELQSGTAINLKIVKGPYKVLVDPQAGDFVKLNQQGNKLIIRAVFNDQYRSRADDYTVVISCPDLTTLTSDTRYEVDGLKVTDTVPNIFEKKPTLISGFNTENLVITEGNGSNIRLEDDHLGYLKAVTNVNAILSIGYGNIFNAADFHILSKSTLNIESLAGSNITYQIADSAKLTINGAISKQMLKTTQP